MTLKSRSQQHKGVSMYNPGMKMDLRKMQMYRLLILILVQNLTIVSLVLASVAASENPFFHAYD